MAKERIQIPNITLSAIVQNLKPLIEESFIEKAQDLENNWLKLRLHSRNGSSDLVFSPKSVFISEFRVNARAESSGFGAFLKKHVLGKKIVKFEQKGFERIVELELTNGIKILAELFAKGNILILDEKGNILRPYRKEHWSSRELVQGKEYVAPPSRGLNPLKLTAEQLRGGFESAEKDAVRELLRVVGMPPIIAEEACVRAGIDKQKKAVELEEKELKRLAGKIIELYSLKELSGKAFLVKHGNGSVLLPFESKAGFAVVKEFESLNSALNELFLMPFLKPEKKENKRAIELEKSIEDQKLAMEKNRRAIEENKLKAEAIYTHYADLTAVLKQMNIGKIKKEIMYKKVFGSANIDSIDFKNRKIVLEIKE